VRGKGGGAEGALRRNSSIHLIVRRTRSSELLAGAAQLLAKLERRLDTALAAERRHMEAQVASRVAAAAEEYRPLRLAGTFAVLLGLAAQVAARLI
jgi:hypothetical protein